MYLQSDENAIVIWRFHDAPQQLRDLSGHGGDEDWVAYIPPSHEGDVPMFIDPEYSRSFGVCDTSTHKLQDGSVVLIGAHG